MLRIRGAREHNLKDLALELPLDALVVFCGVSGSGKSSLAFDTLHQEGQRRYLEALSLDRAVSVAVPPAVDAVDGLPPTVALTQRAASLPARATVGSVLDVDPVLRVLFARAGTQHCPVCDRAVVPATHDEIVSSLVVEGGDRPRLTIEAPLRETGAGVLEEVERAGFSRLRVDGAVVRIDEAKPSAVRDAQQVRIVVDRVRATADRRDRIADSVRLAARAGRGVLFVQTEERERVFVDRPLCWYDDLRLPDLEPSMLTPQGAPGACEGCDGLGETEDGQPCPTCRGARLSAVARAVRWRGHRLSELAALPARGLAARLGELAADTSSVVERATLADIQRRLSRLQTLSLSHLALDRRADRISSSEQQRLRLARQVASPLSGVLYVLDEPSAGLDEDQVGAVIEVLRELVAQGNGVIAVEHRPAVLAAADHAVEFGPGAGTEGGRVLYEGPPAGLGELDTPTGRWLSGRAVLRSRDRPRSSGAVRLAGPWRGDEACPEVVLPLGQVAALHGPSASGKSRALRLLRAALAGDALPAGVSLAGGESLTRIASVDRAASRAARSTPATYVGLWDVVRTLLAATRESRIRGYTPSTFSLNTKGGRCGACRGAGEQRVDMGPLPDLMRVCPVCEGRRFEADVLEVRWKGLDPSELLRLDAANARVVLAGHPDLDRILHALDRVGLGYVPLGQPTRTLSGGEAARLALARELARASARGASDTVYLLDDPSVGLHPEDVAHLLGLLRHLSDEGATVWIATSNPALAAAADARQVLPAPVDKTGDQSAPGVVTTPHDHRAN